MVVFGNGALRAQYYILTLQRMFKSTSSGYRVDKLGFVSCIRPLKIFCRSLGHIGPVVLDKTLKYRKIIMQICLPIGKKPPAQACRQTFRSVGGVFWDLVVVVSDGGLRPQCHILTLQRMFKSTSSGYRVDKWGPSNC